MAKSIFLEGTDGSGKSTQLKLLVDYLASKGISVHTLREPGGSDYYEALRDLYLKAPHAHPPVSDALLSAAGRAANIAETKEALAADKWVITDRSYLSSYVYQSVQGVPAEDVKMINTFALNGFNYDIKIVLDVPIDVAAKRVNDSGSKKDYWESQGTAFFTKVREAYIKLAAAEQCIVIDASGSIESIHKTIIQAIEI